MPNLQTWDNLCEICNQINFDALKTLSISELPSSIGQAEGSGPPPKANKPANHKLVRLGSLDNIHTRGQTCPLCRQFGQVIEGHNEKHGFDSKVGKIYSADISPYGAYYDPSNEQHWVHRLSLIVEYDGSKEEYETGKTGRPGRHVYFSFQACSSRATVQRSKSTINTLPDSDTMVFSGRKRPLLVDFELVHRWINICQTKHVKCRRDAFDATNWPPIIRLIDVEKRCVVTLASGDHRYIALSYVWGGGQNVTLTKSNVAELAQPGALVRGNTSLTIEDSMLVAEKLGVRYLWVDAVCIIQDDDNDKAPQIKAMGYIYSCALLTIVAASASNANGGLPGLHPNTRFFGQDDIEVKQDLSLLRTVHPFIRKEDHFVEHTPWNSRGWTLQERVLSRCMLIFTEEQVSWICREGQFCEESYFENDLPFIRFHSQALEPSLKRTLRNCYEHKDQPDSEKWVNYRQLVTHYTRRFFSYGGDVFDAFFAVLQGFHSVWEEEFLWGIPRSHFEEGLLWTTFTGQSRRKELSTLPMTSKGVKVGFPSWSWMGWIGETDICIDDDRSDGQITEICCFIHQHDPLLSIVRFGNTQAAYDSDDLHSRLVTLADLKSHNIRLHSRLENIPEEQLLFFWASSAMFYLKDDESQLGGSSILDYSGKVVGSTGVMPPKDVGTGSYAQGCEFIVIGSRRNEYSEPVLLVLLIRWQEDVAYRVNIGEIFEEDWVKSNSSWKLIALG